MSLRMKFQKLAGVGALVFGLLPAASYAATCVVDTPDPDAMITGAENTTACGIGSGNHPTDLALDGFVASGNWGEIGKVDNGTGGSGGQLLYTGTSFDDGAATEGEWGIDLAGKSYTQIVLVLKDGDIIGSTAKWVWFLVDLQGSCPNGTTIPAASGADLCGDWFMYGQGTERKAISYMAAWGVEGGGRVPEPASLLLIGLGFAGLALVQRRRRTA